jgi:predicted P-loop ATPase
LNTKRLSDIEEQGLIKSFEFTYELAWKTMKDYLEYMELMEKTKQEILKAIENDAIWMERFLENSKNWRKHDFPILMSLVGIV